MSIVTFNDKSLLVAVRLRTDVLLGFIKRLKDTLAYQPLFVIPNAFLLRREDVQILYDIGTAIGTAYPEWKAPIFAEADHISEDTFCCYEDTSLDRFLLDACQASFRWSPGTKEWYIVDALGRTDAVAAETKHDGLVEAIIFYCIEAQEAAPVAAPSPEPEPEPVVKVAAKKETAAKPRAKKPAAALSEAIPL